MRTISRRICSAVALVAFLCTTAIPVQAAVTGDARSTESTVTYTPSTDNIANPERGLYHHTGDCDKNDFALETLKDYRESQKITLVMCVFYLAEFKAGPISDAALAQLQEQLDTVRAAGLKTVLRFAYTTSTAGDDAPKERVLAHLDQLAPYLRANSDVISLVQAGFIGAWGEWYYTQHFGNEGNVTPDDWAARKAVTDKILEVLPRERMVQLRTPKFKRTMYGTDPLPPDQAYDGSANARLGHHNDCFLASPDDFGTYEDPAVEYPYLQAETRYLVMGGETCATNPPRSSCPTAGEELTGFHWSYLNTDYHPDVLAGWSTEGCLPEITRRLGYRFTLDSGTYPDTASPGGELPIAITLTNDGRAAPYNPRGLELVLRNAATGEERRIPLKSEGSDPRRWSAGSEVTLSETVTVPADLPAGDYELLLALPDPALPDRPEYAIQAANVDTWEPATGLNRLLHTTSIR